MVARLLGSCWLSRSGPISKTTFDRICSGSIGGIHVNPISKRLQDVLDEIPVLTPELIQLIHYMKKHYGASLGEVLQTVIPAGLIQQTKKKIFCNGQNRVDRDVEDQKILDEIRKRKSRWKAWGKKNLHLGPSISSD